MKQVSQRLRDGRIEVLEVPPPQLRAEGVLVDVRASLVSAGTERKKVETGRQTLLGKARSRPDQVRQVLEKARRDGVADTVQAVRARLEQPSPLGYSAAGIVLAAGERVSDLVPGDRVACAGAGYASHAEIDYVPANLAVPVPDGVELEHAAFATVGSIALHGVRQADVRVGERVAVIGLGLVGQLAGQILRASGCRVVGVDLDAEHVRRAAATGAADVAFPRGDLNGELPRDAQECDAVVVTAATRRPTPSSWPRGSAATAAAWWSSATSASRSPAPRSTRRSSSCGSRAPTGPAATTPSTRSAGSTIRSATCAGRSGATWPRSSSWSPAGR